MNIVLSFYILKSFGQISAVVHKLKERTYTRDFTDADIYTLRQPSDLISSLPYVKGGK
jgi:hypothetical protein